MVRNVILSFIQGRVKLCDFGYDTTIKSNTNINPKENTNTVNNSDNNSKENTNIDTQEIVGTLQYLSPQYVQGFDSGAMRDVWAVGIIGY